MWSEHDLNFSVPNTIMRNCVKRTIAYNPSVACETAKNDDVILRENNISHNRYVVPVNLRLTSCDTSSKLQAFEEAEQELLSDLSTLKNEIKTNEEVLSQDICQNASNNWSLSGCDKKDSALSLVQLTEKEDLSISTAEILEKYFAMCNTILSDDAQYLINHESTVESSEERDCINETQEKFLISQDSIPLEHKLTLILPRCNCATNNEQSGKVAKSDQRSEESNEKSEYVMILASVADICCNALLHDANYETPEEYVMHFLKKESEEQFIFPYSDENTCQRTSCSFYRTTTKKQVQLLSKECIHVADLTAMEQLSNELLILIQQMYHMERSMLFIGLIDVISSMEQNLAEFIILAEDATHLLAPLNFLTHLTKFAEAKSIPYIYACKKKQLGQACCVSTYISAISIRVGPSYFSEEIKKIKCMVMSAASRKSSIISNDILDPSSN